MRAVNVLLSVVVSLALACLVLELGLRLFPAFRPKQTLNEFDPDLGWSKVPGKVVHRSTPELDVTFEINSMGLRDDEMSTPAKPESTYRILALGDSFVLGYTVARHDLFVDLAEHWWQSEQRRVDVINAGTEGYSTDQEVVWFQEHGVRFQPDLVLIFPYENDIYWNGQTRYTRYPKPRFEPDGTLERRTLEEPPPQPASTRFALGNLGRFLASKLRGGSGFGPDGFQPAGSDVTIHREFAPLLVEEPRFVADALTRTRGALIALQRTCREVGARLLMVPIPSESAIHPEEREKFGERPEGMHGLPDELWSPDRPVDSFLGLARGLGIETLDPRPTLRAYAEAGRRLYFEDEWHWNAEGNRDFAHFLIDSLHGLDVFPPDHAAITAGDFPEETHEGGVPTWLLVFAGLWLVLGTTYAVSYRREQPALTGFLFVGALLAAVFTIVLGGSWLFGKLPHALYPWFVLLFLAVVLGFVAWKLGRRLGTIAELLRAFTLRGHWYLMPLVVVLLSIGSLLVVAASSPLIAPFIYTLF